MAGVGEASAIVGLISTAASLSKAVIDIASKYKVARLQIESFGQEVGILGNILGQLHRLYSKDDLRSDGGVITVIVDILDQCSGLFAELETYRDALYSRTGSVRNVTFLGKAKWVFEAKELEYLRTRVESMKLNMLLMMIMQCVHGLQRSNVGGNAEDHADDARILSIQSEECAKRLQALKSDVVTPTSTNANPVITRMSIDTTASVRSITQSILSLYGHESLYETPSEAQGEVLGSGSMQIDQARVSRIIEDHIRKSAVVAEDEPSSDLILPYTFKHCPEPRKPGTASDGKAAGALRLERYNHLVGTELCIPTEFSGASSDQHQYVAERNGFFFSRKTGEGVPGTERSSLILYSAVRYYENGRDGVHHNLCIYHAHRLRYFQLDERPMMILDSLVRQLPLHNVFKWRRLLVPVPWGFVKLMLDVMRYTSPINRQYYYREALAAMLQTVNEDYVTSSCRLYLNGQIKKSKSVLNRNRNPLALYQKWAREGHMTFSVIQKQDTARK